MASKVPLMNQNAIACVHLVNPCTFLYLGRLHEAIRATPTRAKRHGQRHDGLNGQHPTIFSDVVDINVASTDS